MTRSLPALLLLLVAAAGSPIAHLHYERLVIAEHSGQTCTVLGSTVYTHASATLADLRLFTNAGAREVPFVLFQSGSLQANTEPAQILNLRQLGTAISFDLQMPARAYTDVVLDLAGQSLLAHATVTAVGRTLGDFTLFKLNTEHLPDDTTLHLQEIAAPVLHITLTPLQGSAPLTPALVLGAAVPPSREAQTLYTTALTTSTVTEAAGETRARFLVPPHLPIERVRITLQPGKLQNLSRTVRITSHAANDPGSSGEQIRGTIGYLHLTRGGAVLNLDQLSVPATLGANLQTAAEVEVAIENGSATPLPIASIALETRQHQLCFNAQAAGLFTLFYGDPELEPARYDLRNKFRGDTVPHLATLGPEQLNPRYTPREQPGFLSRKHPRSAYLGLIFAICFAGIFLLRSKKLRI